MAPAIEGLEEAASLILEAADEVGSWRPAFVPIAPSEAGFQCAAVDGGSTVVLDVRSVGLYSARAGFTLRDAHDRFTDRVTTRSARTATRRAFTDQWRSIVKTLAWGADVDTPPMDKARLVHQLSEAERILAEYDAARKAIVELQSGDLLLLDGSLDDEERFAPLRASLLERAAERGVVVAAFSKDSGLSLGGVLPFTIELEERAAQEASTHLWWADVTEPFKAQEKGHKILGVHLDARSPVYRVDVAGADPALLVSRLASLCNDAAYPGYPYPLARIHGRVHYGSGEALDLRRELEYIVGRRRGQRLSLRLFGRGRDVLALAD